MEHVSPPPRQFLRYAGAGAFGTICHYAVLIVLVKALGAGALVASTAGAVAGALVNYVLNYHYTFSSNRAHSMALPRFGAVALVGIGLNALVMAVLTEQIKVHYLLAQVAATLCVLAAGFLLNRKWTF
jgi:putative flippase GtrA